MWHQGWHTAVRLVYGAAVRMLVCQCLVRAAGTCRFPVRGLRRGRCLVQGCWAVVVVVVVVAVCIAVVVTSSPSTAALIPVPGALPSPVYSAIPLWPTAAPSPPSCPSLCLVPLTSTNPTQPYSPLCPRPPPLLPRPSRARSLLPDGP